MVPFQRGADGVVARTSRFAMRFETLARERPHFIDGCALSGLRGLCPPSAALRWLRDFLLMPQPPLLHKEGNVPLQALPAGRRDRLDRIHIDAIARRRSDDDAFHLDLLADV